MKRIFIPSIIIFFLISCNTFSQDKNQTAENMAVRLQQKVLLSKDQTAKVKDILINYIQAGSQASLQTAQKNVESLLDKRQKAKYDIIKDDWWSAVRTEASKIRN